MKQSKTLPKRLSKKLKEEIKRRYNYVCYVCGIKFPSRKLTIHRIQAKRYNLPIDKNYLIPLCRGCHRKVEKDIRILEESLNLILRREKAEKAVYVSHGHNVP